MASTPYLDEIITEGVSAIPTTELWTEIRDLLASTGSMGQRGFVTLAGSAGVAVTITDMSTVDAYNVFYSIEKDSAAGSIGEITIKKVSGTEFTVFNTGSDRTSKLVWWVVPV